jgi:hypothetical protein
MNVDDLFGPWYARDSWIAIGEDGDGQAAHPCKKCGALVADRHLDDHVGHHDSLREFHEAINARCAASPGSRAHYNHERMTD